MKKYRCPYCGEECITSYDISRACRSNKIIDAVRTVGVIMFFVLMVLDVIFACASHLSVNETIGMVLFVSTCAVFPLLLISLIIMFIHRGIVGVALVRCPGEESFYESQNAHVMLTGSCVKIKNSGIYGLKFDIRVRERRFLETFKNELVPAVFHREGKSRNRGPINVELMKRDFIPKELLRVGSSFAVWDNGKVIGHGMITEILEKEVPPAKEKTRLRILYKKIFLEKK